MNEHGVNVSFKLTHVFMTNNQSLDIVAVVTSLFLMMCKLYLPPANCRSPQSAKCLHQPGILMY